jgi:hypothetical protein
VGGKISGCERRLADTGCGNRLEPLSTSWALESTSCCALYIFSTALSAVGSSLLRPSTTRLARQLPPALLPRRAPYLAATTRRGRLRAACLSIHDEQDSGLLHLSIPPLFAPRLLERAPSFSPLRDCQFASALCLPTPRARRRAAAPSVHPCRARRRAAFLPPSFSPQPVDHPRLLFAQVRPLPAPLPTAHHPEQQLWVASHREGWHVNRAPSSLRGALIVRRHARAAAHFAGARL